MAKRISRAVAIIWYATLLLVHLYWSTISGAAHGQPVRVDHAAYLVVASGFGSAIADHTFSILPLAGFFAIGFSRFRWLQVLFGLAVFWIALSMWATSHLRGAGPIWLDNGGALIWGNYWLGDLREAASITLPIAPLALFAFACRPDLDPNACSKCGYSLQGLEVRRCPECGTMNA